MTNEESIDYIEKWKTDYSVDAKDREVLSMAIKALKQQPCEDTISRQAAIDAPQGQKVRKGMSNTDVIIEVLLRFTEPYLAIGETNHDKKAYNNLLAICHIHDYCCDLIRENAELKGNKYSIVQAREKAIRHISESIVYMRDLLDDLKAESEDKNDS